MLNANEKNYILAEMANLVQEYDYKYTHEALSKIIDTWAYQKAGLIEAFKKHPNYIEGKFMIAFDTSYERNVNLDASVAFARWIINVAMIEMDGKFPEDVAKRTEEGDYLPEDVYDFFVYLKNYAERCVSEETANYIDKMLPNVHVHVGQKTSRVVNKICNYLGFDKVNGYNREFAKYADSLSPVTIKRHTVLSINPLDYLTMSFGNSWASCHTIDKENRRNMPNSYSGCYSSGTISYMLDPSSMVLYTIDASYDGNEYWTQPKINRQMFHYGEEKLIQGRLYPQDNDGFASVYTPYRNIVQEIISTIYDFPNLWTLKKGADNASKYIYSRGTHYRDYEHYSNCTISRIKGSENDALVQVGSRPICIHCGDFHSNEDNISCCPKYICSDCGEELREDDIYWINGEAYCRSCVEYCCICEEYVREGRSTYIESEEGYVCNDCRNNYYFRCDDCGEWIHESRTVCLDDDTVLCDDCYETRIATEEIC